MQDAVQGRVLVMGDSISDDGRYIAMINAYLKFCGLERRVRLMNAGVSSETLSGLSEPGHPFPRPCGLDRLERAMALMQPDWVLLFYGMNDGIYYPLEEGRFAAFRGGVEEAVRRVHRAGCKAAVATPIPFDRASYRGALYPLGESAYGYDRAYEGYDEVLAAYSEWILEAMPGKAELVVDLRGPMEADRLALRAAEPSCVTGDGIHPDDHGHWVMARALVKALFNRSLTDFGDRLTGTEAGRSLWRKVMRLEMLEHRQLKETIGHGLPQKAQLLPPERLEEKRLKLRARIDHALASAPDLMDREDSFRGYPMRRFYFDGYEALTVFPRRPAEDGRWALRCEFFGAFADADEALLQRGYQLAYIRLSDQYGAPEAVEEMERFRRYMVRRLDLSPRMGLIGLSRGGLYVVQYAGQYPQHTAALYLDAPVVDIQSWPGRHGTPAEWAQCLAAYGLGQEGLETFYRHRDAAHRHLLEAEIPLILVAGDSDTLVPYEENGALLAARYQKSRAPFRLLMKPGAGHHPHGPADPQAVADFWAAHGRWRE